MSWLFFIFSLVIYVLFCSFLSRKFVAKAVHWEVPKGFFAIIVPKARTYSSGLFLLALQRAASLSIKLNMFYLTNLRTLPSWVWEVQSLSWIHSFFLYGDMHEHHQSWLVFCKPKRIIDHSRLSHIAINRPLHYLLLSRRVFKVILPLNSFCSGWAMFHIEQLLIVIDRSIEAPPSAIFIWESFATISVKVDFVDISTFSSSNFSNRAFIILRKRLER